MGGKHSWCKNHEESIQSVFYWLFYPLSSCPHRLPYTVHSFVDIIGISWYSFKKKNQKKHIQKLCSVLIPEFAWILTLCTESIFEWRIIWIGNRLNRFLSTSVGCSSVLLRTKMFVSFDLYSEFFCSRLRSEFALTSLFNSFNNYDAIRRLMLTVFQKNKYFFLTISLLCLHIYTQHCLS